MPWQYNMQGIEFSIHVDRNLATSKKWNKERRNFLDKPKRQVFGLTETMESKTVIVVKNRESCMSPDIIVRWRLVGETPIIEGIQIWMAWNPNRRLFDSRPLIA